MSRSAVLTAVAVTLLGLGSWRRGSRIIPQQSSQEDDGYDWEIEMVLRPTEPGAVGKGTATWGNGEIHHLRTIYGEPYHHSHNDAAARIGQALEGKFDWMDSLEELLAFDDYTARGDGLGLERMIGKRLWPIPWLRRKLAIPANSHHTVEVISGPEEARIILRFKSRFPNLWQRQRDEAGVYGELLHDLSSYSTEPYETKEQLTEKRLREKISSLLNFPGIGQLFPKWQRVSDHRVPYPPRELVEIVDVTLRPERDHRTLIGYDDTEPVRRV